jgi:hypothetical protein
MILKLRIAQLRIGLAMCSAAYQSFGWTLKRLKRQIDELEKKVENK